MAKIRPYHYHDVDDAWFAYCIHTGDPPITYTTPVHLIGYSHYDECPPILFAWARQPSEYQAEQLARLWANCPPVYLSSCWGCNPWASIPKLWNPNRIRGENISRCYDWGYPDLHWGPWPVSIYLGRITGTPPWP
jgi:hypothetical protein